MVVMKWGSLAGALLVAGLTAPPPAAAQDREPVLRAFEMIGGTSQIGVSVSDLSAEDAKTKTGVVVDTVSPDSPADKAGVKAGDAITEFDGERVRSVRQFTRLVTETNPGRSVPVTLMRGTQRVTVNITPERRGWNDSVTRLLETPRVRPTPLPPTPRALRPGQPFEWFEAPGGTLRLFSRGGMGVTIETLDDQLAEYFGVKDGVLVKSVSADSVAAKAGVKAGDVITAIDGRKVYETSDVSRALGRVAENGEFTIEIVRDKKTQTLKGKLEPREPSTTTRRRTIL